jgi:hypothetical protein
VTISVVHTTQSNSLTTTIPSTTAGNCLVVVVMPYASETGVTGVTLGGSADNFSKAVENIWSSGAGNGVSIWVDPNCAGGQTSVVISGSGLYVDSSDGGVVIYEVSGLATSSVVDKTASNNGDASEGSSYSSGTTATTTVASEIFIGGASTFNALSTLPSGYTNTEVTGDLAVAGYQIVSSTGTATYAGTQSSSGQWAAGVVTLKANSGTNVNGLVSTATVAAHFGSLTRSISLNPSAVAVIAGQANAIGLQRPPAVPVNPGYTWKKHFKRNFRQQPLQPAIGQIQPPYSPPGTPINPGQAWKKRFGYPKRQLQITYNSPTTKLPAINVGVIAPSHTTLSVVGGHAFSVNVSAAAYFGSVNIKSSPPPATVTIVSQSATKITKSGIVSTVAVAPIAPAYTPVYSSTYSLGRIFVLMSLPAVTVNVTAYYGNAGITHPLTGEVTQVSVAAYYGHVGSSVSITKNISVAAHFGMIRSAYTGAATATISIASTAASKTVFHSPGTLNIGIYGEYGHVRAGNSQTSNPAAVTVAAYIGTPAVSSKLTGRVSVTSAVHAQTAVSGNVATVFSASHIGTVKISLNKTSATSVAANSGTPKISKAGLASGIAVFPTVHIAASPHGIASAVSVAAAINSKISTGNANASVQIQAYPGTPKIFIPGRASGVTVAAQKEGTDVGVPKAQVSVQAHAGYPAVIYEISANVTVIAYYGAAGVNNAFAHIVNGQWGARLWQ